MLALLLLAVGNLNASTRTPPDPELRNALVKAVNSADSFKDRYDAEVWLLDMSQRLEDRVPDSHERLTLLKNIQRTIINVRARLIYRLMLKLNKVT